MKNSAAKRKRATSAATKGSAAKRRASPSAGSTTRSTASAGSAHELAAASIAALRRQGSAARRAATVGYFPTALENLGVGVPVIRKEAQALGKLLRQVPPPEVLKVAYALLDAGTLEGRQLAYELVGRHRATRAALGAGELTRLGRGMDNWASVDAFSCEVAGHVWREGQIDDGDVRAWATSNDPWWRRAALASTIPLNSKARGGSGDRERTLMVCELLAVDSHPLVRKALSWSLRSLVPHDPRAVRAFLQRHGASLPGFVQREVGNLLAGATKSGDAPKRARRAP